MQVYFDNSATTKPYDEVIDAVVHTMKNNFGNPSSAHGLGLKAEIALNESRDKLAKTINCTKDEIIFTSGGSESNNFLVKGFTGVGAHIITSEIEHPSVLNTFRELEAVGTKVTYLKVDNKGRISLEELKNSINSYTRLVSIIHVNNELGVVQDIEAIGTLIKEKSPRVKFHVDAVQSYGKFKIDVKKAQIDLLSVSGHKIHGPRGVGFSYIKKGFNPKALISGGGQELKEYFIERLRDIKDIVINSPCEDCFSPYILSISFIGVRGEVLLHLLEEKGIYVSTGSACSAKKQGDSHVLKAIGLNTQKTKATIRFSFNEFNTKEEVDYTIEVLEESLKFLRRK